MKNSGDMSIPLPGHVQKTSEHELPFPRPWIRHLYIWLSFNGCFFWVFCFSVVLCNCFYAAMLVAWVISYTYKFNRNKYLIDFRYVWILQNEWLSCKQMSTLSHKQTNNFKRHKKIWEWSDRIAYVSLLICLGIFCLLCY